MGELSFFQGMQIKKTPIGTIIYQKKYNKELLQKFHMNNFNPIDTRIRTSSKLDSDELGPLVNKTMYREIIRVTLYLTISRPDIVFSEKIYAWF